MALGGTAAVPAIVAPFITTNGELRMRFLIAIVLAATLTACATKPISEAEAVPVPTDRLLAYQTPIAGDSGTVVTIRDAGFTGGGCNLAVYINGELAAQIGDREIARFHLPAGDHIIGTGPTGRGTCVIGAERLRRELGVTLRPGETKKFRLSINPNSGPAIEPTAF